MKFAGKLFLVLTLLTSGMEVFAGDVFERPITAYGTPATITVDNVTLTKVPATQTTGRYGFFLAVPTANTGEMVGFMGDCTSTALASTIQPMKFIDSGNSVFLKANDKVCLWLITTHSGAESIHVQEIFQ